MVETHLHSINTKCIAVVGLGYVGLPLAAAFSDKGFKVFGFDVNSKKIRAYKEGQDLTGELGTERLKASKIEFTDDPKVLSLADTIIVAVPTPVTIHKTPYLEPLVSASRMIGKHMKKGAIVVYESTVYPGATEEECLPVLEQSSGMIGGVDFKIGYSPERISPGEKNRHLKDIVKIVSGMDEPTLTELAALYGKVVDAGIHKATSIKVAEAAKVIENAQRDVNIAFVNELSLIFNRLGISTREVLEAAGTKWNFLKFVPGLVGGHCIGVDPYYLAQKAESVGYHPEVLLAGRRINDRMAPHIATELIRLLIAEDKPVKAAKVLVMGLTFKENVGDIRNSKVVDVVFELKKFGVETFLVDPWARSEDVLEEYNLQLTSLAEVPKVDAVILAVSHDQYKKFNLDDLKNLTNKKSPILVDVKGQFKTEAAQAAGFKYWSL